MQMTFKDIVKEQVPPQVVISIIFVVMLAIGYGVWSEETNGNITLSAPLYGTELFVDGKVAGQSHDIGEKMSYKYPSGKHSVIVSRGDFWPWTKDLTLHSKENLVLLPFLVRKETKPSEIPANSYSDGVISPNQEYTDAVALINAIEPKEEILAALASMKITNARAADYYPGRKDVLLVAVNNGIFAVETGSSTPRNFQPVYKGIEPVFAKTADNVLLIKDGNSVLRLAGFER